ncbi:polymorphic outer membrane protein [Planoprotostelium fungivorum]|uniref:Polymorphic outer membrane protein n=1 Tax=Planoprotostelium fungivorum TaxID=1890364 RepID=A0A2P6MN65_9EUKA|nr:polymorphic outer membrane protein [Planoprotostelium fungivorum]
MKNTRHGVLVLLFLTAFCQGQVFYFDSTSTAPPAEGCTTQNAPCKELLTSFNFTQNEATINLHGEFHSPQIVFSGTLDKLDIKATNEERPKVTTSENNSWMFEMSVQSVTITLVEFDAFTLNSDANKLTLKNTFHRGDGVRSHAAVNGKSLTIDFCEFTGFKGIPAVSSDNGEVVVSNSNFYDNHNASTGAALFKGATGQLSITKTQFKRNSAVRGGAVYSVASHLSISDSVFEDNMSTDEGGALWVVLHDAMSLANTNFTRNKAGFDMSGSTKGGALFYQHFSINVTGAVVNVLGCTFMHNNATEGGGVWADLYDGDWKGTTFTDNEELGGGLDVHYEIGMECVTKSCDYCSGACIIERGEAFWRVVDAQPTGILVCVNRQGAYHTCPDRQVCEVTPNNGTVDVSSCRCIDGLTGPDCLSLPTDTQEQPPPIPDIPRRKSRVSTGGAIGIALLVVAVVAATVFGAIHFLRKRSSQEYQTL